MKVAIVASPLPGLTAREVCDVVSRSWLRVRPGDVIDIRPSCDGIAQPFADSGAAELLGLKEIVEISHDGRRRFIYRDAHRALFDYTSAVGEDFPGYLPSKQSGENSSFPENISVSQQDSCAHDERNTADGRGSQRYPLFDGVLTGKSSAFLGEDIVWAVRHGLKDITVVLPSSGWVSDLGRGAFLELALARFSSCDEGKVTTSGAQERTTKERTAKEYAVNDEGLAREGNELKEERRGLENLPLVELLQRARSFLSGVHITVLTGGEQRLLGLSGVARSWVKRGMKGEYAQNLEKALGREASQIVSAVALLDDSSLLSAPLNARGIYAGAGGGLGFALEALGARIFPLRQAVKLSLNGWAEKADLAVCVTGHVGEELPESVHAAVEMVQKAGIPLVLMYDSGGIRRGELARIGLDGAYELRSGRAFDLSIETPETVAELSERLEHVVASVSHTWGW